MGDPRRKDTVGELASVDLREEKRIGWTKIESKTISTKAMQLMSLPVRGT
jgi:hypothetical protein